MQHLGPEGGVHFLVGAAAGQTPRPAKTGPLTVFTDFFYGFTAMEFEAERIKVTFVDSSGEVKL